MQDPNNIVPSQPFSNSAVNPVMSKVARTHRFKKAVDPTKCRECDNNVYFHGVECEVVSSHNVLCGCVFSSVL